MTRFLVFLCTSALVVSCSRADVIFEDDFSGSPPDTWTASISGDTGGSIITSGSGQFVFVEDGGAGAAIFDLTRTISTVGFESITFNLAAFQEATTAYEPSDQLGVFVNTGGGFVEVFRDVEVWNGVNDLSGEAGTGNLGNGVSTATGEIALSAAADENAALQIRIRGIANTTDEVYLIDHFTLSGTSTAIPEPSTFAGVGLLLGVGFWVRRRKAA